eukprot:TRINITY_DN27106_c0_g1_i1.p1 TRINITY_DN27106_c0_g1~~TRINITY_DN27106_c0_g1_i1.p1  ORF type:complete len:118 (+),score=11.45 TRINITY_DN27106_c0_g1_i1:638-991(+)
MVPKSQEPYIFRPQSLFQMGLTKKIRENNRKKSWVSELRKIKKNMVIIFYSVSFQRRDDASQVSGNESEKPCHARKNRSRVHNYLLLGKSSRMDFSRKKPGNLDRREVKSRFRRTWR